jgi:hypothetical protein
MIRRTLGTYASSSAAEQGNGVSIQQSCVQVSLAERLHLHISFTCLHHKQRRSFCDELTGFRQPFEQYDFAASRTEARNDDRINYSYLSLKAAVG